jgi:hypothetical protein
MKIESRIRRLVRAIRAIRSRRKIRTSRGQAISDLRVIGDWLCHDRAPSSLRARRPSGLERNLSEVATRILRQRKRRDNVRVIVRLQPMNRNLGLAVFPNQILLHPELCANPRELATTLCHELAHHSRGIEYDHDEVFQLEACAISIFYGKSVYRRILQSLR